MPKPWIRDYVKVPMAVSDENQHAGSDITPGRDMGTEAPDNGVRFAGFGETRIHVNPALFEQVPRLDTSNNSEPDMQQDVDDMGNLATNPTTNNKLTARGRISRILTPGQIDPLTQQPQVSASSVSNTDDLLHLIAQTLQALQITARAQIPSMPARLSYDGLAAGNALVANTPVKIWGQVEGKNVPFLQLIVQNNSGAVLFIDFDKIATAGSIQVPANGGLYEAVTMADTISIMTTGTPTVNGNSSTGVVIRGWTNPEWRNMWGQ